VDDIEIPIAPPPPRGCPLRAPPRPLDAPLKGLCTAPLNPHSHFILQSRGSALPPYKEFTVLCREDTEKR